MTKEDFVSLPLGKIKSYPKVETVGDLIAALAIFKSDLPVRTCFEAGGNMYYTRVEFGSKDEGLVLVGKKLDTDAEWAEAKDQIKRARLE